MSTWKKEGMLTHLDAFRRGYGLSKWIKFCQPLHHQRNLQREPRLQGHYEPRSGHPRPMKGILVAITVMNCTLASKGRLAMYSTARATLSVSIVGSGDMVPLA